MSTRQATPGPSTGPTLQPHPPPISKKRAMSEGDLDADSAASQKRMKKDPSPAELVFGHAGPQNKDRKKRKKRKRKTSVVLAAAIEPDPPRARSKSRPRSAMGAVQPPPRAPPPDTKPSAGIATSAPADGAPHLSAPPDASPHTASSDKGKDKAIELRGKSPSPIPSTSIESPEAQIARLTKELESQSLLLQRHQTNLTSIHQSLTCQICLDLLHKPFAMAPCGHVACHSCLVRWFTAPTGDHPPPRLPGSAEPSHVGKRKTCPICRTAVAERPVEVWGIKSMVGNLVRSSLVELAVVPPPTTADDAPTQGPNGNPDPWRNIFRSASHPRGHFDFFSTLPPVGADANAPRGDLAEMGMYDAEDGGIYRCIDCMNEIWEGACTGCGRAYAGHRGGDGDDDSDGDLSEGEAGHRRVFGGRHHRQRMFRDFITMLSRGPGAFDPEDNDDDDDESDLEFAGGGVFNEDDEDEDGDGGGGGDDDDDSSGVEINAARLGELGEMVPVPYLPAGFRVFADFTDEENESRDGSDEEGGAMVDYEDGYESSFVDDEDDDGGVERDQARSVGSFYRHGWRSGPTPGIELLDSGSGSEPAVVSERDGNDEGAVDEEVAPRGTGRVGRRDAPRRGGSRVVVLDSSDESGSSDVEIVGGSTRNGRTRLSRRRQPTTAERLGRLTETFGTIGAEDIEEGSDGDDDDERGLYGDDGSIPGPASRLRRLMDEDEEA